MEDNIDSLSIQSLSESAVLLANARKDTIKKYAAYVKAKEIETTLRFQFQSDLERFGNNIVKEKE